MKQNNQKTGEFNNNSPELIWGKPTFQGEELSIFFINIPRSRFLISKIFKVLQSHEAMFIEIPKPDCINDEIMNLTGRINEYRIILRRSYFNLDSKIRPYYTPKEVKLVDEVKFQNNFDGFGNPSNEGNYLNIFLYLLLQHY